MKVKGFPALCSKWMFISTLLVVGVILSWRLRTTSAFYIPVPSSPQTIAVAPPTTTTTKCFFTTLTARQPSSLCFPSFLKLEEEEEEKVQDLTDEKGLFSWDERWDNNIAELIKYNETFGTVNAAYTHFLTGDEYASIAIFCYNARKEQGRLSKERHDQLTSMGFTWEGAKEEKDDQQWEEMYQRLKKYKKNNGDCLVPKKYERDQELGIWVQNQRAKKKKGILKEERTDKLNSIGFVWVVINRRKNGKHDRPDLEMRWEARRQELINFHKENGDYWVPEDYKNKKNPLNPLARWVSYQRTLHKQGNLRKDRVKLLDEIDFTWDAKEKFNKKWNTFFDQLKGILSRRTDHAEVYTKKILGTSLYGWVQNQRELNEKGALDDNRKARLDEIGFEWIQVSDK